MIVQMLDLAQRANDALKDAIGRPYHVVLGVGLTVEIIRRVRELLAIPASERGYVGIAIALLFCAALLLNQLAELSERLERRRNRR